MNLKRRTLPYLALLLFIAISLTSCTPPSEIIVACDVGDLINAINSANANSDATKLILDPNCTYPFTNKDNSDGGQGPNALPIVTTKIIIEGNNATLDRLPGLMFRYFFITDSGSLRLEDITIENGDALITSGVQPNTRGGAIYNDGGGLRAERSIFRSNIARGGEGGAIYNLGILTIEDTLFELNISDFGAAIYNGGNMDIAVIIQDATFDSNTAHDSGGAIYNYSAEQGLLISGTAFVNNHSYFHGGAIFTESTDLNISNSEFISNLAGRSNIPDPDWGDGGAIYTQTGDIYIFGTYFDRQRANGVGGMLYAGPNSEVKLREVQVEESKACHGGGALYVEGATEVLQITLKDSSVGGWVGWNFGDISYFDECSGYHGGAIYNTGTLALDSSLLEGNWVIDGDSDGIYNIGDLTIVNSTVHYDTNYINAESRKQGLNNLGNAELSFTTFVYSSLVNSGSMTVKDIVVAGDNNGCYNSGTLTDIGENIAVDPACPFSIILPSFGDVVIQDVLSDNGGPTLTNFVGNVSPLIDMSDCLSVSGTQVINDQRGVYRPYPLSGTHDCDIGALETYYDSPPPPPPLPPTQMPEPSPSCDPFEGEEISLVVLNLPGDTRNLPVYLRVAEGIFPGFNPEELDGELTFQYNAKLGKIQAYQVSQQGFPERVYFMIHIPEGMEGTAQLFELRLNDCPDPVYLQPNVLIPVPITTDPFCTAELNAEDCKKAGGSYEQISHTGKYQCVCP